MRIRFASALAVALAFPLAACSSGGGAAKTVAKTDADYQRDLVTGMHDSMLGDLDALAAAARQIQAAAPTPQGRGWDPAADAAAMAEMRRAWVAARDAYEHVEGALAPLFPDIDAAIDARYDDFLGQLQASGGDADPFDDKGVTGMHAIERILYIDTTPARVVDLEKSLPAYRPAALPATEAQAAEFKNALCAKLIADVDELRAQWQPQRIDVGLAFQGLIALMKEQREKVNKASTSEEESRYAQRTMADIRANLEGTRKIYGLFQPWLASKNDGGAIDARIESGFTTLRDLYASYPGDAVPPPPDTWSNTRPPTADELATPFGKLYAGVHTAIDPAAQGSLVDEMNAAATALGFPTYVEEKP